MKCSSILAFVGAAVLAVTSMGGTPGSATAPATTQARTPVATAPATAPSTVPATANAGEAEKRRAVLGHLSNLRTAVQTFEVDNGRFPTTKEGLNALVKAPPGTEEYWHGKYVDAVPKDSWGNEFVYRGPDVVGQGRFEIVSAGPDGKVGTNDDLTVPTP